MKLKRNIAISENGFLFNPETGDSFLLNPIAREIVNFLKEGNDVADVKQLLFDRYEVDLVTLEKNLEDFLEMLQHNELLDR
ncbi:PqqD family protein [Ancylomarina euxinus]|uniref:PqqD family protein n=1 Tax=Ancylomarina euxinus TaxID=2283627 RepID=A0A425XXV9_9BACT|nr:PqqD family protein [Ancylomarina euxinus]MCZ4696054.1 PqqD family protein [Ancylomarina euxinus]MUP13993.1 PqqD family peptide modification chaperone [Ancylomarina euxinus]RRG19548.1 PqqD family protein [Ancylomarina euxinus]